LNVGVEKRIGRAGAPATPAAPGAALPNALEIENPNFDWGDIPDTEAVGHTFNFKNISDKTVKNYASAIFKKLNLERRSQTAAYVARHDGINRWRAERQETT
jgi:hypothetical protein